MHQSKTWKQFSISHNILFSVFWVQLYLIYHSKSFLKLKMIRYSSLALAFIGHNSSIYFFIVLS